jgi:hypothetical protein
VRAAQRVTDGHAPSWPHALDDDRGTRGTARRQGGDRDRRRPGSDAGSRAMAKEGGGGRDRRAEPTTGLPLPTSSAPRRLINIGALQVVSQRTESTGRRAYRRRVRHRRHPREQRPVPDHIDRPFVELSDDDMRRQFDTGVSGRSCSCRSAIRTAGWRQGDQPGERSRVVRHGTSARAAAKEAIRGLSRRARGGAPTASTST